MSATARSILSDSLQGGARQGPPGQIHTGREPSENIDAGAVDIPGAIPYTFTLPRGGETALYASSTNLASSLPISDTDVPHVVGSMTLGYGTSPGHGLGHMMRSRRRPAPTLGRRNSSKEFALPSHSEYAEFLATSQSSPDYPDAEAGMAAGLDDSYIFSPLASGQVDENKVFSLSHNELTAPLLPARSASGAVTSVAKTPASKAAVFGTINAIAGIPALVAYAAIVFRHPVYAPYVDLLCKMFFISSALHQSVFCLLSTIPFAMGQVQDVGIIFLSAMGTSVAEIVLGEGKDAPTALGTALLTMTTSTFIVGLGTLFVARKSLASFVHYIPLPVMGGYLGFVGYFCIASGIGLGSSVEIGSLASWSALFARLPLIKLIPTVTSCVLMVLTLEKIDHPLALPGLLLSLVAVFHLVLLGAGLTLKQAQEAGWAMPPAAGPVKFWELWSLYHLESWSLSGIYFPAMFRQAAKTLGLMLVVIFGSCMDIAAIQQDVPYRIDFNRELTTVAVSNIATGTAFVGFTGSYIFSQTIFTMRAGVTSRINGWVIAAIEAAAFLYPYSIVQYFPNYFLGALLVWFGVEISRDWLVLSYFKLTLVEYGLLWLTFASVMQWGLEGGIAAGIVCATLYFAYAYAQSQVQSLEAGRARSTVVRTVEHQTALGLLWDSHVATAHLQGFVFFGSAQSIGGKLHEIAARLVASTKEAESVTAAGASMDADGTQHSIGEEYGHGDKQRAAVLAVASAPRFFVIDFSKVTGMDSSGARTIASVCRELGAAGITPILTNTDHHGIVGLLNAHDVVLRFMKWPPELRPATPPAAAAAPLSPTASALIGAAAPQGEPGAHAAPAEDEPIVFLFRSREEGLRFCEDALLEVAVRFGLCTPPGAGTSLEELLSSHLDRLPLTSATNVPALAAKMRRYLQQQTVRRGEVLWNVGDSADELFLVERGVVRVDQFKLMYDDEEEESEEDVGEGKVEDVEAGPGGQRASHDGPWGATPPLEGEWPARRGGQRRLRVRSFELGPGCVAGSTDFYLARPHGTRAVCASVACRVLRLSRHAMMRMAAEAPVALNILQMAIMRLNSSDLSTAADAAAAAL